MQGLSFSQANNQLINLIDNYNNGGLSNAEAQTALRDLVSKVNPTVPGSSVTLLYSGQFNGTGTHSIARDIANQSNGSVAIIDDSSAGQFISQFYSETPNIAKSFAEAIFTEAGVFDMMGLDSFLNNADASLTNGGIGAIASKSFAEAINGPVVTLTPNAIEERIFGNVELPALLENSNATHVNGIDVNSLSETYNSGPEGRAEVFHGLNVRSADMLNGTNTYTQGDKTLYDTESFFNKAGISDVTKPNVSDADYKETLSGLSGTINADDGDERIKALVVGAKYLDKLGVVGDVVEAGLAVNEANTHYQNGDKAAGDAVVSEYIIDTLSGSFGGVVGTAVAGLVLSVIGVSTSVVAVPVLAAGALIGSTGLGDEIKEALEGTEVENIVDRLASVVGDLIKIGADYLDQGSDEILKYLEDLTDLQQPVAQKLGALGKALTGYLKEFSDEAEEVQEAFTNKLGELWSEVVGDATDQVTNVPDDFKVIELPNVVFPSEKEKVEGAAFDEATGAYTITDTEYVRNDDGKILQKVTETTVTPNAEGAHISVKEITTDPAGVVEDFYTELRTSIQAYSDAFYEENKADLKSQIELRSAELHDFFGNVKADLVEIAKEQVSRDLEISLDSLTKAMAADVREAIKVSGLVNDTGLLDELELSASAYDVVYGGSGDDIALVKFTDEVTGEEARIEFYGETSILYADSGNGVTVKVTDTAGEKAYDVLIGNSNVSLGQVGSIFGSHIGRTLAGDNQFEQIGAGTLLGAAGNTLFETTGLAIAGQDLSKALHNSLMDLDETLINSTAGAVGSYLVSELLSVTGLDGIPGQVLETTSGTVVNNIIGNIIAGEDAFAGATSGIGSGLASAGGSFLGTLVANELVQFDNIGTQIGGSVGSYVGSTVLGTVFAEKLGVLGSLLAPGVGTLLGSILGGFIGSIIGGLGTPESGQNIEYDPETGFFKLGGESWEDDGASVEVAIQMANSALSVMNATINALDSAGAQVANLDTVAEGAYGQHDKDYAYWTDGENSRSLRHDDPRDAINEGLQATLNNLVLRGGDIYVKRALFNYLEQNEFNDQFDSTNLLQALSTGLDYSLYRSSETIINSLVYSNPETAFSLGWLATLEFATGLNLQDRHVSDFFGGLGGYLSGLRVENDGARYPDAFVTIVDSDQDGELDDLQIEFAGHVRHDTIILDDAKSFYGFGDFGTVSGDYVGTVYSDFTILDDAAGAVSLVDSANADDPQYEALDPLNGQSLLSDDIFIGNNHSNRIDGGHGWDWLEGRGGNDDIIGGHGRDILMGGDGNDSLYGNDDDDYLTGDGGTDLLVAGDGEDTIEGTGDGLQDTIDGGAGIDLVSFATSENGVYVNLLKPENNPEGADLIYNVENLEGSQGHDSLFGSNDANDLKGYLGDDRIESNHGNDTLTGGRGHDTLIGGFGSNNGHDVFEYTIGDGYDLIRDTDGVLGNIDTLRLHDINVDEVKIQRKSIDNQDLILVMPNGDKITVDWQHRTTSNGIERIEFDDGTVWDRHAIRVKGVEDQQSNGDDDILGYNAADVFEAGLGDDTIDGGESSSNGSDTYIYTLGDGTDYIVDDGLNFRESDTLVLRGINPDEVIVTVPDDDGQDLLLKFADGQQIRINYQHRRSEYGVERVEFDDGTVWSRHDIRRKGIEQQQSNGDDNIDGYYAGDTFEGGLGNDTINGGSAVIENGADTYLYKLGDGKDRIIDTDFGSVKTDKIILSGISPDEVQVTREAGKEHNLKLVFADGGEIIVNDQHKDRFNGIEEIHFDDGTVWSRADIRAIGIQQQQSDGDDYVQGYYVGTVFEGGLGDDTLNGGTTLSNGHDTYIYKKGDGKDVIIDKSFLRSETDTLVLRGIFPDDADVYRTGNTNNDLLLKFSDGGQILIKDHHKDSFNGIERIEFDDGTIWDKATIRAMGVKRQQTDQDDTVIGYNFNDTFEGGLGDDTLEGGHGYNNGHDTYIYNLGDGKDLIIDDDGYRVNEDTLLLRGIAPKDVIVTAVVNQEDHLRLVFKDGGEIVIQNQHKDSDNGVEFIKFDDGTIWSRHDIRVKGLEHQQTDGDDYIIGYYTGDTFEGGPGYDKFVGGLSSFGNGSDTYVYTSGDGEDVIYDYDRRGGMTDTLMLRGVNANQVSVKTSEFDEDDIVILLPDGGSILLDEQSRSSHYGIEKVQFDDGTVWNRSDILERKDQNPDVGDSDPVDGGVADPSIPEPTDTLTGTDGHDSLSSTASNERLEGLAGNDLIESHQTNDHDVLVGGAGDDTLKGNIGDRFDGGTGVDYLDLRTEAEGHYIDLAAGYVRPISAADTEQNRLQATGIERISGTSGHDVIYGRDDGDDFIDGYNGEDKIYGLGGNDTIQGGFFRDTLDGGDGIDTLDYSYSTLDFDINIGSNSSAGETAINFENVIASSGANTVTGSSGANKLDAGAGNDTIHASGGDDTLIGGDGDDHLFGGTGIDVHDGGAGNDTADFSHSSEHVDISLVNGRAVWPGDLTERVLSIENIFGSNGNNHITGDDGANYLHGLNGHDLIDGGAGNDTILGGSGVDTLHGGDGIDLVSYEYTAVNLDIDLTGERSAGETTTGFEHAIGSTGKNRITGTSGDNMLDGLAGSDTLVGGAGNDTLTGGAGEDIFVFAADFGKDTITDFVNDLDVIDLSDTGQTFGDLALSQVGADVLIADNQGNQITLLDQNLSKIDETDFIFSS